MRKPLIVAVLAAALLAAQPAFAAPPPSLTAKSAIVIEALTGEVLYGKAAEERRYPASTTKMMTLIVALEHGNSDDMVTTSAKAASTEGSSLWLTPGEKLRLGDLLYGIMLVSGNDATVAVAEHISGSLDNFAKLMTEKAHAIGARSTNFTNSSGLPDPNHYSTALDLARMAAYGYRNPEFAAIVGSSKKIIPWPGKDHDRELFNENKMLWMYEGGNGVKTGFTEAAGRCLVSGAKRNGIQLIAVVLDSPHMWEDSIKLLDFGFSQVKPVTLHGSGDILKTVHIGEGVRDTATLITRDRIVVPAASSSSGQFRTVVEAPSKVAAPVAAGQKVGVLRVMYNGTEVAASDLVAAESVPRRSFFGLLWSSIWNVFSFIVKTLA